jgi:hypothetical protein
MAALTGNRDTKEAIGDNLEYGMAANAVLYVGALAVISATGFLQPATTAVGLKAAGAVTEFVSNAGGANGAKRGKVKPGIFRFDNSTAGDLIVIADIGNDCFIVDDQTVAKTNGGSTRSTAGKIIDVDASGVWVKIGFAI